jgi:hypothetical protein
MISDLLRRFLSLFKPGEIEEAQEPLREAAFHFELRPVPLDDGTSFDARRDTVRGWIESGAIGRLESRVLYELKSGDFVLVLHDQGRLVSASRCPDREAAFFLSCMQAPLPMKLRQLMESGEWLKSDREPRPLSHWQSLGPIVCEHDVIAHEVEIGEIIANVVATGIELVQAIRDHTYESDKEYREIRGAFVVNLYATFPVDPTKWWGRQDCIPPARVSILELQWPLGTDAIQNIIREMHDLLDLPLACICFSGRRVDNPSAPTREETQSAEEELRKRIPELERLIVQLRTEHGRLTSGEIVRQLEEERPPQMPPPDAFLAYHLREIFGFTQAEIATRIAHATGGTTSQGTISRWLSLVDAWKEAKNALPAPDTIALKRAFSMDPSIIDAGARVDGRRPPKSGDND